jgi:fibronectin-binding autotransporter adhesin
MMKLVRLMREWLCFVVVGLGLVIEPGHALAQRPLGIDVSSYQYNVNWTNVKSTGVTFAWAKATQGNYYVDAYFANNENYAKAAGVCIGAYDFADYNSLPGTNGAVTEANFFWSEVGPYLTGSNVNLMPALDVELAPTGTNASATVISTWVNKWCSTVVSLAAAAGITVHPVVYTFESFATSYLNSSVTQWPLWMASPNGQSAQTGAPSGNGPWSTWTFWQYGEGSVSGITNGSVDVDAFNGTASQLTQFIIGASTNAPTPYAPAGTTLYWDPLAERASPGSGGTGSWDTATADWWLGGSTNAVWSPSGDYAVLAGTAGTVTVANSITADGLTFDTAGYTIGGAGVVTLAGTGDIVVPAGSPTYLSCELGGVAFNLSGGGVFVLSNAGNYSAGENITGPNTTLVVTTDHPAGDDGVTMNFTAGGIYQDNDPTSGDEFLLPGCAVALLAGGGIFDNPNASLTMSNYITGSGSLTLTGYTNSTGTPYVLTLTHAANNYSGGTIVNGPGELKSSVAGALGSTTGALTVSGGILDLGGVSQTAGAVTISGGKIQDGTLTGSSYTGEGGTVSATLAGAGKWTQTSGATTLSGANTYTGITTVGNGLLEISADNNLGAAPGSAVTNQLTLNNTNTGNYGLRFQSANFSLSANRGITLGTLGGSIQVAVGQTETVPGIITGSGALQCGTSPTVGEGTLILNGANTYAGATVIAAGTLQLGASGSLPATTALTVASAGLGGIFNLTNFNQTIGSLASSPGINGTGTTIPAIELGSGTLTISGISQTTFGGSINGSGGLTLTGGGSLTLSGTNTYSGNTTVSAGTLALGSGGSINNTPVISIAAGATLDVSALATYTLGGSTTLSTGGTAAPATINGGTTVSLGSQPIILTYDGAHPALTISQGTLSLNGNAITVNGPVLGVGTYTLIQQASGSITTSGIFPLTGTALGATNTTAFVSVSGGNVLLTVANIVPVTITGISLTGGGAVQLNFSGTPDYEYLVEAATNLVPPITWTVLSNDTADTSGNFSFIDTSATNYNARFYRTALP